MAKKKTCKASPKRSSSIVEPPPLGDLRRYVDFVEEGGKFGLPVKRVAAIAREVEADSDSDSVSLRVTTTQSESALREKLEAIHNEEIARLEQCPFAGCGRTFSDIHTFVIHQRIHIATEAPDFRVRVAVLRDIERILVPVVEKQGEFRGVLTSDERAKITKAWNAKGLQTKGLLES